MPLATATRKPRIRPTRRRERTITDPGSRLALAQVEAAFRQLEANGIISGHPKKISARIDHGLLTAAASKLGSDNISQVLQAALAAFVAPDPFVTWFLSGSDPLPADFERAI